jgi:uncharacterized protein YdcH (DUF465 family)
MDERELKQLLSQEDPEFQQVFEQHQECEKRLEELGLKSFLTDEEEQEEKALKKRKLVLKDKMYIMMTRYQKSRG